MKVRKELITPEIAKVYLKNNSINRKLNKVLVEKYADAIKRNQWCCNGETIIIANNGKLLDGQHRLEAVILADKPISSLVVHGMSENVFSTLDNGRSRSGGDVFELAGIKNYNIIAAAIRFYFALKRNVNIVASVNSMHLTNKDLLDEYLKHPKMWDLYVQRGIYLYRNKRYLSQNLLAALYAYLDMDKGYTLSFIDGFFVCLFCESQSKCNVINLLRNKLINNAFSANKYSFTDKLNLVAKAWNYSCSGTSPKTLRYLNKEGRIKFL